MTSPSSSSASIVSAPAQDRGRRAGARGQRGLPGAVRSDGVDARRARRSRLPAPRLRRRRIGGRRARRPCARSPARSARSADLLRDSVSAPFILKAQRREGRRRRDRSGSPTSGSSSMPSLDEIDPDKLAGPAERGQDGRGRQHAVREAASARRRAEGARARDGRRRARVVRPPHGPPARPDPRRGDRPDRRDRSRTIRGSSPRGPSRGSTTTRPYPEPLVADRPKGGREEPASPKPYPGGASYVKISRLATVPGALLVEAHFAFVEPRAWFDGAPILRSKIGVWSRRTRSAASGASWRSHRRPVPDARSTFRDRNERAVERSNDRCQNSV